MLLVTAMALTSLFACAQAGSENLLTVSIAPAATNSAKIVRAKVLIKAPPDTVWRILTNYSDLPHIMPGYEQAEILQSKGANKLVRIAMKVAAFLPTYRYQLQSRENESAYELNLTRVSGDFKALSVVYKLTPQNNGEQTLLTYRLNIDPGFSLPGDQGIIKANTEKTLKAVERHAEQRFHQSVIGQR